MMPICDGCICRECRRYLQCCIKCVEYYERYHKSLALSSCRFYVSAEGGADNDGAHVQQNAATRDA